MARKIKTSRAVKPRASSDDGFVDPSWQASEGTKKVVFYSIVAVIVLVTGWLLFETVDKNLRSVTGGPVHWHADYEVWACGEKQKLNQPAGLLENKVGSELFHNHGDDRMHAEGIIEKFSDVSLGRFFQVIGGELSPGKLVLAYDDGVMKTFRDGDKCANGDTGVLQVFVFKVKNASVRPWVFTQERLAAPWDYVLSPFINVPPGDCIIVEFGKATEKTDKLCLPFKIALEKGDVVNGG